MNRYVKGLTLVAVLFVGGAAQAQQITKVIATIHVDNDDLDDEDTVPFEFLGNNNRLLGRAQVQGETWKDWSTHTVTVNVAGGVDLKELSGGTLHIHKSGQKGWAYKLGTIEGWTAAGQKFLTRTKSSGRVFSGHRRGEDGPADHNFPIGAE